MERVSQEFGVYFSGFVRLLYLAFLLGACQSPEAKTPTPHVLLGKEPTIPVDSENVTPTITEGVSLDFTTIDTADWGIPDGYLDQDPALFVIKKPEDVMLIDNWVENKAKSQLRTLNYESATALVIFQGVKPTGGYGVCVQKVISQNDTVDVHARFEQPEMGVPLTEGFTSPYHIIQIQKPAEELAVATFRLIVGGEVLVQVPAQSTPVNLPSPTPEQ